VGGAGPRGLGLRRAWLGVAVLALLGLVGHGLMWQKLSRIQEDLARRSTDSAIQANQAQTSARQAQDAVRDALARLTLLETRLSEVALQRTQLEELMQSLSRSRDENLVVDIESAVRLAQQQAQLTGSVEPLLAALRSADQRLARATQPRLNPLQRAIARDTDRIKAAAVLDTPGVLLKLDELVRLVDELSLLNAVGHAHVAQPAARSGPPGPWWQSLLRGLDEQVRGLLRVSRIDQPDAVLLAPEQGFFLRENLKLRLLNARLGVLARQFDATRADLSTAQTALALYFDPAPRKTALALDLLRQVQKQLLVNNLPRVDDTLAALATAAAGR